LALRLLVRRASITDAPLVDNLLSEWLKWTPDSGREKSLRRAIRNNELLVAESQEKALVGFIHYVMHEDIIDGGLNAFITAFYVSPSWRRKGAGTLLLDGAIENALTRGAVGVETSTIHESAKRFYMKRHFKQAQGDIAEAFLELEISEYQRD
jgi:GNAT superfamily N-acetyltransferase